MLASDITYRSKVLSQAHKVRTHADFNMIIPPSNTCQKMVKLKVEFEFCRFNSTSQLQFILPTFLSHQKNIAIIQTNGNTKN